MLLTCALTVFSDSESSRAITLLAIPRPISESTSRSRGVSGSVAISSSSRDATFGCSSAPPPWTVRIASTRSCGWTSLSR